MSCFDVQQLMKADQQRRAVFMETSRLCSSVIHKPKHRRLDRICSIKQRLNITSEQSALFSQAILSQQYITSCQHQGAGSVLFLSHLASSLRENLCFDVLMFFFFYKHI